ncbi:MAG: hypothetical protein LBD23_17725, partial [Oscillospiraceae bacterium]|nr:hypothetical protein [Oscillospiraceae bacterium]
MNLYIFPFEKVPKNSNVVLYAAGIVGNHYYNQVSETNYCKVILWLDKNADGILVKEPKEVACLSPDDYDFVIVALVDEAVAKEAKETLIKYG